MDELGVDVVECCVDWCRWTPMIDKLASVSVLFYQAVHCTAMRPIQFCTCETIDGYIHGSQGLLPLGFPHDDDGRWVRPDTGLSIIRTLARRVRLCFPHGVLETSDSDEVRLLGGLRGLCGLRVRGVWCCSTYDLLETVVREVPHIRSLDVHLGRQIPSLADIGLRVHISPQAWSCPALPPGLRELRLKGDQCLLDEVAWLRSLRVLDVGPNVDLLQLSTIVGTLPALEELHLVGVADARPESARTLLAALKTVPRLWFLDVSGWAWQPVALEAMIQLPALPCLVCHEVLNDSGCMYGSWEVEEPESQIDWSGGLWD